MKKVLIITYYWPPAGGPGVQRWLKFVKYLPEYGIEPIVYIPENPHYPIQDATFEEEAPPARIIKRPIFEPYGWAKIVSQKKTNRISSGVITDKDPSFLEKLMLWIRGNCFIPDARKYWVKPSVTFLAEFLQNEKIDTIITTGPPHSIHLMGAGLKRKLPVQWLADFRDPWTTIGYHKKLRLSKWAAKKHEALESLVLRSADHMITTSQTTKEEFIGKTDVPITVITNGYDGSLSNERHLDQQFTISHIGSLLTGRNPENLWKVLSELVRENTEFGESLQLQLVGVVSQSILDSIKGYGLESHTAVLGYVSHSKAVTMQKTSQVLLLIEIDSEETRGIIPGKLFEYLAAQRPILAIGPNEWDAGNIVEKTRSGRVYGYQDDSALKTQLVEWFNTYRSNGLHLKPVGLQQYHRKALTEQLAKLISWA